MAARRSRAPRHRSRRRPAGGCESARTRRQWVRERRGGYRRRRDRRDGRGRLVVQPEQLGQSGPLLLALLEDVRTLVDSIVLEGIIRIVRGSSCIRSRPASVRAKTRSGRSWAILPGGRAAVKQKTYSPAEAEFTYKWHGNPEKTASTVAVHCQAESLAGSGARLGARGQPEKPESPHKRAASPPPLWPEGTRRRPRSLRMAGYSPECS